MQSTATDTLIAGSIQCSIGYRSGMPTCLPRNFTELKVDGKTHQQALNAAIEAAYAGEVDHGFAVVTDEMRTVAHRLQETAEQMRG